MTIQIIWASGPVKEFETMVAHYHGQVWNGAEFARAHGGSEPTARRYLGILVGAYMGRVLPPWHENLKKRQLRMPKIYVWDAFTIHAKEQVDCRAAKHPVVVPAKTFLSQLLRTKPRSIRSPRQIS